MKVKMVNYHLLILDLIYQGLYVVLMCMKLMNNVLRELKIMNNIYFMKLQVILYMYVIMKYFTKKLFSNLINLIYYVAIFLLVILGKQLILRFVIKIFEIHNIKQEIGDRKEDKLLTYKVKFHSVDRMFFNLI